MFPIDSLVLDLLFPADTKLTAQHLIEGLGGEDVLKTRTVVDPDVEIPEYEMEVSPTVPLRRRGERRLLVVDAAVAPLRKNPRTDPIVAKDLRPERDRLVRLVQVTGARLGRMYAFGTWGDAVVVTRTARDLRGLMLLSWALDPTTDLEGRRRATPLNQAEFEEKLRSFDKRLDELDDAQIALRVAPVRADKLGALLVVDLLSDRDGSWDIRKSYEVEKRVAALESFARIPGAKVVSNEPAQPAAAPPPPPPEPKAAPPPPVPAGPPITAVTLDDRVILKIPGERFDLDVARALGMKNLEALRSSDPVNGRTRDHIHEKGCGFVAPLSFLSEVFVEGKPLDKRRFEAESQTDDGARVLEAHLPRFGPVKVVEVQGKRWVTSEVGLPLARLLALLEP